MAERRRFFRINDKVGVAYRVLTEEEANSRTERDAEPVDTLSLLSRYENTITQLLPGIQSESMRELFGALNNKINCIIAQLELDSRLVREIAHRVREVNISACGMAFIVDEQIPAGKILSLDLILRPEGRHIATYGQVLDCEAGDKGFYLRINFMALSAMDQESLIQHIVKRQGSLLREQRQLDDQAEVSELQAALRQGPK
ncbi:PilZ domain-containing protein [Simiduia agarivorans]|uniref:Modification methylase HemK n=1 Tax=Simiduia agarivorans (strain DSM 21679 / JCM 13881 / BCRC 17597 / SA1) TaxID=1117647 RepID=K4KLP2_SIMAS|nr:PilZ domain-containing protein [Simiduia agarivorans]AFU99140.1 modification methylase HemK [Simiduia agarivorans SA1 = DSM 21679]